MATNDQARRQRSLEIMLLRLLVGVRSAMPKVLKAGGISRSQMLRVEKAAGDDAFSDPEMPRQSAEQWSEFLMALARELELVGAKDGRMHIELARCDAFFAKTEAERLEALREAWLATAYFNEFFTIPTLEVVQTRATTRHTGGSDCVPGAPDLRRVRATLLEHIGRLDENAWEPLDHLLTRIETTIPDIMLAARTHPLAHTPDYIGIRTHGASVDLPRKGHWRDVEGALITEMLRFPMHALGLIDFVERDNASRQARLRPSPPSELKLRFDEKPLMIQPNYDVMALIPEMPVAAIWRLARVSSITSFGQAAHFKLEEPWVIQAINTGQSLDEITGELSAASKTPLPQNVTFSIHEWGRRAERITIWIDGALIEGEGIENAAERLASKGASDFEGIGEKHAVMSSSAFIAQSGLLPPRAVVIDYSRSLPPVLRANSDGVLALDHEGSHFRARQAVGRYASEVGLDRYEVTSESLEAARHAGKSANAVVEELGALSTNDLPALFEARVRSWMQGDVEALVGSPTVVHISDERIAALLAKASELNEYFGAPLSLSNFSTGATRADLDAMLASLGITAIHSEARLMEELAERGPTAFAHSHRAPQTRREGFDRHRFEGYLERGMTPALLYALNYREAIVASTTTSHFSEPTLVTPLALWTDGTEAFVELDCRYLHRVEILRVSWLQTIEAQR